MPVIYRNVNGTYQIGYSYAIFPKDSRGLTYKTYNAINTNTGTYYFAWDTTTTPSHANYTNNLNYFINAGNPTSTGLTTTINNNFTYLGFSNNTPTYSAVSFTGYFYAPTTGNWVFTFGASNTTNNSASVFWIGNKNEILDSLQKRVNETNYNFACNSTTAYASCSYTISNLSKGYYPVIFNWGVGPGAAKLNLGITPPGGTITYNCQGYFYT